MTVSAVLPASPFWEMKASVCMHVRMQEARGCVKRAMRAMRVLRIQVTSWGERADWRGVPVPGRGVELGSLGSLYSGLYRLPMGGAPPRKGVDRRQQAPGMRCGALMHRQGRRTGRCGVLAGREGSGGGSGARRAGSRPWSRWWTGQTAFVRSAARYPRRSGGLSSHSDQRK